MKQPTANRLAWVLWILTLVLVPLAVGAAFLNPVDLEDVIFIPVLIVGTVAFATAGRLIASRHRRNPIGWLFLVIGLTLGALGVIDEYVTNSLSQDRSLPLTAFAAWLGTWADIVGLASIPLVFLLFPTGRVPSRRWRPLAWISVGATVLTAVSWMLMPRNLANDYLGGQRPLPNPTGVEALGGIVDVTAMIGGVTLVLSAFLSVAALVVRFRRAEREERQQIKWLVYVAATAAVMFGGLFVKEVTVGEQRWPVVGDVLFTGFALSLVLGIPLACGIAILKFRLYDLDVVIKRTVVFGALAAFITLVYIAVVVGIGALVGNRGNTVLTFAAAAIVAVAFQPARNRARHLADRIVYGRRATPYEVLSDFAGRVAGTYSTEDALPRMARILGEGTGASEVRIWLRLRSELVPAGSWPSVDQVQSLEITADDLPLFADPTRAFAVRHQGELLGAVTVVMPPTEPLTPSHAKLIQDFASQAGLVLRNVRLIEELRASRQRIVAAQDQERRRIERNIHDGAQQQLVALQVKLGLIESILLRDPEKALAMVGQVKADAREALDELRDLARGIYPPLLADQGLVAALQAQARRASLPVEIETDGVERYSQEAEAAVYFCTLEALQNVAKYAGASQAVVRLAHADGRLMFEVTDDGRGFDAAAVTRGTGLTNMADRLAALGGTLEITSQPGRGTTVMGRVPASALVSAARG
jgi:signal transduction histidine kinase